MAQNTVNIQKMRSAASELDKHYATLTGNVKKVDELMEELKKIWKGEGAQAYIQAYVENKANIEHMAEAIRNCSSTLTSMAASYEKADLAAADAIKSKIAKG